MGGEIILTDYDGIGMERAGAAEYVDSGEGTADNILHSLGFSFTYGTEFCSDFLADDRACHKL